MTLLPSSFLADTPGDGISAPLRRRYRGRRRRGWLGGLLAGPDSLFQGGGRGVFPRGRGGGGGSGLRKGAFWGPLASACPGGTRAEVTAVGSGRTGDPF